jgi:hypothetical protein
MSRHRTFKEVFTDERKKLADRPLRWLAAQANIDPGYLSRVTTGKVTPRLENITRIVDALAKAQGLDDAARDALWKRLADAAMATPNRHNTGEIQEIKDRFEARLRQEPLLSPKDVREALESVSLQTMLRVLTGLEELTVRRTNPGELAHGHDVAGEEVVVLGRLEEKLAAGPRAVITVTGPLTAVQREQLDLVRQLVRSILASTDAAS